MWRGEARDEFSYGSQHASEIDEQNFDLCSVDMGLHGMNNSQRFPTEPSLNYFPGHIHPGQVSNHSSKAMETSYRLHNNTIPSHELYGVCDLGYGGNIYTNIQPRIQDGVNIGANNEMGNNYGQSAPFCHGSATAMKRRAEDDYMSFCSGAKRRITDEHMAAGMNSLYITNDHNYSENPTMFNPDDDLNMQFSTISDEIQNNNDQEESKEHPVFHFVAPVEEMMKKKIDILPSEIMQEICKPCLAVIPWIPPLHSDSQTQEEENGGEKITKVASTSNEMEDDNLIS